MSATSVLSATEFQSRLERYLFARSEEWRAVRVGEKEVSEQAEIVRRYADLFSREELDAVQEAGGSAEGGGGGGRGGGGAALPPAQDLRVGPHLGPARRARGRAREQAPCRACDVPR